MIALLYLGAAALGAPLGRYWPSISWPVRALFVAGAVINFCAAFVALGQVGP